MWNRRSAGMTLIELIIAMVIITIGVAGLIAAYTITAKTSADPMISKQMGAIAEGMMEEIMLKPYASSANAVPAANARDTFNDVRDYNGFSSAKIYDISGAPLAGLDGFALGVSVVATPLSSIASSDALKITITVTHAGEAQMLTGWRTCYAGPPC
jgi:MSHA pilin protein MshD